MEDLNGLLESEPLSGIINILINISGLRDFYTDKDETENTYRVQNLEELINASLSYPAGTEGLRAFLEDVSLNSSDENPYHTENKVNLITIHNTKGLEFERIIITGMEDGLFPYYTDKIFEDDLDIEEERRLFYVGMTRAKKSLLLTTCRRRQIYGTYQDRSPSRFLFEIPSEYTESYTEYSAYNNTGTRIRKSSNNNTQQSNEFPAGCEVFHNDYGAGVIAKNWFDGENEMVNVNFFSGKTAKFILKYSSLEKISTD
jgi:DNA helicase-2/ATP-dependent DNA helicase PcrA